MTNAPAQMNDPRAMNARAARNERGVKKGWMPLAREMVCNGASRDAIIEALLKAGACLSSARATAYLALNDRAANLMLVRVNIPGGLFHRLVRASRERDMTVHDLSEKILKRVLEDDLVAAVLDDGADA